MVFGGQFFVVQDFGYNVFFSLRLNAKSIPQLSRQLKHFQKPPSGAGSSVETTEKKMGWGARWGKGVDSKPKSQKQQNAFLGNTRI